MATLQNFDEIRGPAGADGADGSSVFVYRATWSFGVNYAVNDVVNHNGSGYVCVQASFDNPPHVNPTIWQLLASQGDQGIQGVAGNDGADGADGLGVPTGGTTGQLLSKASNADNDTVWIDAPVATGNANRLALFDGSGQLSDLAAYQYNPTRFNGMDWSVGVVPAATNSFFNLHNFYASFDPTVSNSQENWRHLSIESAVGTDESGNQLGDATNGSIGTLNLYTRSNNGSSVGQMYGLISNIDIGHNDPTPNAVTAQGATLFSCGMQVRDNASVVGGSGFFSLNFNAGTTGKFTSNVYGFNINGAISEIDGNGFVAAQCNIQLDAAQYVEGYKLGNAVGSVTNGVNSFADFSSYTDIGQGYFGVTIQPSIDACESFFGVNVNPTVDLCDYAYGINADVSNVTVYAGVTASLVKQDITYTGDLPGADYNQVTIAYTSGGTAGSEVVSVSGFDISVQIESGVSTAQNIVDALDAASITVSQFINYTITGSASNTQTTSAAQNLAGGINPGFKRAAYFKGDVQIDGSLSFTGGLSLGAVSAFSTYAVINGSGTPTSTHTLITNPTLGDNLNRTNADYLGVNTAMLLTIGANSSITTGFLGVTALGLPAVVGLGANSTVDRVGGAVFAISLDGSAGAGSNIGIVSLCRALALPNGITAVDRLYGYEFDLPFGDPGTDTWGIYMKPNCHNWIQGNLRIGGDPDTDDTPAYPLHVDGDAFFEGANLGFFGVTPAAQQTGGVQTATGTYTATEQGMIQSAYDCLRTFGLLS